MKIIYVAGVGKYGTYILTRDILTIWLKYGYEIVFVGPVPHPLMIEFLDQHRIPRYSVPLVRMFRLDQALKLTMIARLLKADIIHSCTLSAGRFLCKLASLLSGVPLVLYLGTPIDLDNVKPLTRWLHKLLHNWAVTRPTRIIAMTQFLAHQLCSDPRISKNLEVAVIPAGVNTDLIRKKDNPEYNKDKKNPDLARAVQVARLGPEKGQDIVIKAASEVFKKGYKICVDFIGDETYPGYQGYLRRLAADLGLPGSAVNFLGYHSIDQVYQELAEYDFFLHPSRSEGQGIAVVEAMAAGLAVVASEVDGLTDLVVKSKTGLLVPSQDHRALAEAIITLINDPLRRISMGEAGYQRAKEYFSLEATETKLMNFYKRLAP